MNPIGPDGDARLVPMNMQTLENAIEGPPDPPAAADPFEPADDDEPDETISARMFRAALDETIEHQARKVQAAVAKHTNREDFLLWRERWFSNHLEHVARVTLAWRDSAPEGWTPDSHIDACRAEALRRYDEAYEVTA